MASFGSATDSSHENEVEEIIIDITQIREPAQWHAECCIYKVPNKLRNVKKESYTPKLISIGPVHQDNAELANMQKLKLRYFNEFFSRTRIGQKELAGHILENEDKIRHCYAEEISLRGREGFVKMILLDSIFIIELFLRSSGLTTVQKDYILSKPWLRKGIEQDLILLENQLPFFILNHLYNQIKRFLEIDKPFLTLVCDCLFPGDMVLSTDYEAKHFTDLQRYLYHPPNPIYGEGIKPLHCATKLDTAGLLFRKRKLQMHEENPLEENRHLLDIKFEKPSEICLRINCSWPVHCFPCLEKFSCLENLQTRLVIPQFVVDDGTEDLFRNLMALEQCHYPVEAYICNYILLLDFLIKTKEDVELLVEENIIVNSMGSNEAVANMVNKLGQEIIEVESCYYDVADAVHKHYSNSWNQNMGSLKNIYFRDIWRGTATVGGALVVLTSILTFLTPFVWKNI